MSAVATRVQREQRYTRGQPCPVCGGWQSGPKGQHCHAFYNHDFTIAYCSEIAGDTPPNRAGHYAHRVDPSVAKFTPRGEKSGHDKRNLHAVIPQTLRDGWHKTMVFPYHNADGSLLYNRVRYDPPVHRSTEQKRVLPFQPVGDDWAMDEEGLADRLPLYRWPDLLAAPSNRPVFIPEGEKCADALRALGLLATTNPNGAGNWHVILPSGSQEALRGHPVVLLPDAGEKGHAHMQQVAASLADVAASIREVELPGLSGKEDVVEWLSRGGTKDELYELVIATPVLNREQPTAPGAEAGSDTAALRAANIELNKTLSWTERVTTVPKTHISPGAKETALWLRRELPRHARQLDADGFWTVYLPTAAKARGVSASVLGNHLMELDDVGAYHRRERPHMKPNCQRITRIAIAPGPVLDTPENWLPTAGPRIQHGGARPGAGRPAKCPSCQSANVKIVERTMRVMTCKDCGEVTSDQIGPDRPVRASAPDPVGPEGPSTGIYLEFRSTDHSTPATTQKKSAEGALLNGDDDVCTVCGGELEGYDVAGQPFCAAHRPQREAG